MADTLTFAPGQLHQTVTVQIIGDTVSKPEGETYAGLTGAFITNALPGINGSATFRGFLTAPATDLNAHVISMLALDGAGNTRSSPHGCPTSVT
jgi:hypothetical protein